MVNVCVVPFCKRKRHHRKGDPPGGFPENFEWMCGDHWKPLPRLWRRAYRRAVRRETDAKSFSTPSLTPGYLSFASVGRHLEYCRSRHAVNRLWERLKRRAIETATGI